MRTFAILAGSTALAAGLFSAAPPAQAAVTRLSLPRAQLAGMTENGPADPNATVHVVVELTPRGDLETLAARAADPGSTEHAHPIDAATFADRFGRISELNAVTAWLRSLGVANEFTSRNGLVAGGIVEVRRLAPALNTTFVAYKAGTRTAIAPRGDVTVPFAGVRAIRGLVAATAPRLADVPQFTEFRGDWYTPARFRSMTDAADGAGQGQRIAVIEDGSDTADLRDIAAFLAADGAPPGASATRIVERSYASKKPSSECGRDDRGQEATLDIDAALTMAPLADVTVQYDDVCAPGVDGSLALARALEDERPPTVIVLPFVAGAVEGPSADAYGSVPLPYLEALVRGIPIVVPSGDDGALGYRVADITRPRVAYPCVLAQVVCAGGTQLGDRLGRNDEGPWNDREHASGGGISADPRPAWQDAPSGFEFSTSFVHNRIVPDVAADAAGHLRVFWKNYGSGGIGGTSESAALIGAQIAAVNSAVARPIRSTGDLYVLARAHPEAFRDSLAENDRGYRDNTLRPRPVPPAKTIRVIPPTPAPVLGCARVQSNGCNVARGYDAVTGLGNLLEKAAIAALR